MLSAVLTRGHERIGAQMLLLRQIEAREKLRFSKKAFSEMTDVRGVDDAGLGRIRSKGDTIYFCGHTTQTMHAKFGRTHNRSSAGFLTMLTIATAMSLRSPHKA